VTHEAHTFIVQEMDRNRIVKVKIVTQRPAETQV
jgi:CBS domain containing-hemolysin-like protein